MSPKQKAILKFVPKGTAQGTKVKMTLKVKPKASPMRINPKRIA